MNKNNFLKKNFKSALIIVFGSMLIFGKFFSFFQLRKKCEITLQNCPKVEICVKNWLFVPSESCIVIPPVAPIMLQFPFHPSHPVKCQQGNAVANRSHNHENILFAVDLHSLPQSDPGIVYASADGVAYTFDQCEFRYGGSDAFNDEPCGEGYGNHIRILHKNGYFTLYAHLSKILVDDHSKVKKGEQIGIEGASGRAGVRHLHFSVHRPKITQQILNHPGWTWTISSI